MWVPNSEKGALFIYQDNTGHPSINLKPSVFVVLYSFVAQVFLQDGSSYA